MIIEQRPTNFSNSPKVLSSIVKSRRRSVSPAEPPYQLAKALVEQEKWDNAIAAYQEALTIAPTWVEVQRELGDLLLKLERWEEAVKVYETAITLQSDVAQVHHNLGDALMKLQRWEDAIAAYQKAIELNPNFSWSYNNLGDGLRELQHWNEAAQSYQKAIELKPDFALSHHNLGDVLVKKEAWEEAIAAYQKAIELEPNFVWSHYNLAEVYVQLGQWDEAVEAYQQALKIQPDLLSDAEEKLNQALHHKVKAKLEQALSYYRQAIEKDPTDVESYHKALEIQPNDTELYLALENALMTTNKVKNAFVVDHKADVVNSNLDQNPYQLKKIDKIIESTEISITHNSSKFDFFNSEKNLKPIHINTELYLALAEIMVRQSRLSKAIALYNLALRFQPNSYEAQLGLKVVFDKRNRLQKAFKEIKTASPLYSFWLTENLPSISAIEWIPELVQILVYKPLISIIVPVYNTPAVLLEEMIQSVLDQIYPYWELCIADDASTEADVKNILLKYIEKDARIKVFFRKENGHISAASNSALSLATGDFISLLDHDDMLTPDALYEVVLLLNQHPEADMIYSDEDKINEANERLDPFFKPDWCPDSFLSRMYTCHLGTYRHSIIQEIGGFRVGYEGSQDYDLVLRFTEKTNKIFHIPKVLYHWRIHPASTASSISQAKPYAYEAGVQAIQDALNRRSELGTVLRHSQIPGIYTIRYNINEYKRVSIIIPTRNLGNVLDRCLKSIFEISSYPNYEIILIDNGTDDPETLRIFEKWKEKEGEKFYCYRLDIPFNYSRLNNYGVSKATGEYLLFLNNDTEVITSDWIEAMVEQAQRNSIGVVGAMLLYPNNTIQHAGVILGLGGGAGHSHKHFPADSPGYVGQLFSINNYSAVTGACMICRREVFEQVYGFDQTLKVAYNDVDFCLKVKQKGYNNICLPHVVLYHHESISRGYEDTPEKKQRLEKELKYLKKKWGKMIEYDSCYSPNLTTSREDYSLKITTEIEVIAINSAEFDPKILVGFNLDSPQPKQPIYGALTLRGWVLGSQSRALFIEVVYQGTIIHKANISELRPDVAQVFPHVSESQKSGFLAIIDVLELSQQEFELEVRVVLENKVSASLGTIKLRY